MRIFNAATLVNRMSIKAVYWDAGRSSVFVNYVCSSTFVTWCIQSEVDKPEIGDNRCSILRCSDAIVGRVASLSTCNRMCPLRDLACTARLHL